MHICTSRERLTEKEEIKAAIKKFCELDRPKGLLVFNGDLPDDKLEKFVKDWHEVVEVKAVCRSPRVAGLTNFQFCLLTASIVLGSMLSHFYLVRLFGG